MNIKKYIPTKFLALSFYLILASCGGGPTDRQETLDRMRALGVTASPLVSVPSTANALSTVELKLYFVLLAGQDAEVAVYTDDVVSATPKFLESEIVVDETSYNYQDYETIRIFDFSASLTIPEEDRFAAAGLPFAGTQVRYGFNVTSGGDSEVLVGTVLVYPADAEELSWQNPTIAIAKPVVDEVVKSASDVDLLADVTNPNLEDVKVGWFATSGEIANRRSSETVWTTTTPKQDVLIATIRGKKSKGFAIQVLPVNVE